jgi:hypothetical protein
MSFLFLLHMQEDGDETSQILEGEKNIVAIGETVTVHDKVWERVEKIPNDTRAEFPHFDLQMRDFQITDHTKEINLFWKMMPVDLNTLLNVVRDRADEVSLNFNVLPILCTYVFSCLVTGRQEYVC